MIDRRPRSGPMENSPPIYRWDPSRDLMVSPRNGRLIWIVVDFSRPFHGLPGLTRLVPSDKSLGYFRLVRSADEKMSLSVSIAPERLSLALN